MTTTSSTQNLGLAIADLSQKLSEIASLMIQDAAKTAASVPVAEEKTNTANPQQKMEAKTEQKKSSFPSTISVPVASADTSGADSSAASDPVVTIEQVRAVLAEKSQAGLTGKVKNLLEQFGAAKLSGVNPADYEKLITAAKALS